MPTEKPEAPVEVKPAPPPVLTFADYCAQEAIAPAFAQFVAYVNRYKPDSTATREAFARAVADTYKARI